MGCYAVLLVQLPRLHLSPLTSTTQHGLSLAFVLMVERPSTGGCWVASAPVRRTSAPARDGARPDTCRPRGAGRARGPRC